MHDPSFDELMRRGDSAHAVASAAQRELLDVIAEVDRLELWWDEGARDTAHWVSMRYHVAPWRANKWVAAARVLGGLPGLSEALDSGTLGIDKVVELARYATPETEASLIAWAGDVSPTVVRLEADTACRTREEAQEAHRRRYLSFWRTEDGASLGISAELPAEQGIVVKKVIDRIADRIPDPAEGAHADPIEVRRADALFTLASTRAAADPDPDRATLVVHLPAETLAGSDRNARLEDGQPVAAETARRLACDARIQVVLEDWAGQPIKLGRVTRDPSAAMMRLLRARDLECRFPGCHLKRYAQAHHIRWWSRGGSTDIDNLLLLCSFHHQLVHEHGWRVARLRRGKLEWFTPKGERYRAGPAPPPVPIRFRTPRLYEDLGPEVQAM